jgi:hypothetical protein
MKPDLLNPIPSVWREQNELARKIGAARHKNEKQQIATLLCQSLARMTDKPKGRRPL